MKEQNIVIPTRIIGYNELSESESDLLNHATEAAKKAYAPYSHFSVGAAALLESGVIVTGSNQENAAYPSGLCAERTALFYAGAEHPDDPVILLVIVALDEQKEVTLSISPCGACRQVMIEVASRFGRGFPVLLAGREKIISVADCRDLLPLRFDESNLYE